MLPTGPVFKSGSGFSAGDIRDRPTIKLSGYDL